jgi:ATP-dependent DNA helicase RecG
MSLYLDAPIHTLKGVGEKTENLFNKMGVYTVRDILSFFPRDYKEYPPTSSLDEISSGETVAIL